MTGRIPPELGNLAELWELLLGWNELTGPIPAELGNLSRLGKLYVDHNKLSGQLPTSLLNTSLQLFWWHTNARLCAPDTPAFRTWLGGISEHRPGPFCSPG